MHKLVHFFFNSETAKSLTFYIKCILYILLEKQYSSTPRILIVEINNYMYLHVRGFI